jgi:hypothetical protein
MVSPTGTAVVPTKTGGALVLSPAAVGGRRRRGTKKMTKKVKAMLKKMKLMGGDGDPMEVEGENDMNVEQGGRRRRRGRGSRRTRRSRRHAGLFA